MECERIKEARAAIEEHLGEKKKEVDEAADKVIVAITEFATLANELGTPQLVPSLICEILHISIFGDDDHSQEETDFITLLYRSAAAAGRMARAAKEVSNVDL